ncbi:kelch-like protein 10 [Astyanax mexicanus]|uniref:kelch-like protein 10 n=1 Tax=Astyanax mexicanus TaxID=7994 RepID=UPI0020CB01A9|nr:kelch-like protein 10 [Astyanax mexicanus]
MNDSKSEIWNQLRLEDTLCDVVLKVDGVQFRAHKLILCACSEYFRVLLTSSHWTCSEQREYTILDVSPDIMELIIEYAYCHKTDITSKNVVDLLIAADKLDIQGIKNLCCGFLQKQLCPENCISIWRFTELYSCHDLYQKAYSYMLQHFEEVILEPVENFLELTLSQLSDILDNSKLSVKQEETVFEAVMMWIDHAPQLRSKYIPVLLQKVRMGLMNPDYVLEFVMKDPLVCSNQECQPIITRVLGSLLRICRNGPTDSFSQDPVSRPRIPGSCLFALSGWNGGFINAVEFYNSNVDCWTPLSWVDIDETPRGYYGTAVLDGHLYVLGGFNSGVYFNTVKKLNPLTQTWHQVGHMQLQRCYVTVAVLDGLIYAMGGHSGRERLSSVERYDPKTNQWSLITSMQLVRSDASATALNGKIYICGGYNGRQCLSRAECFDPLTDNWSSIAPMQSSRSGLGVAAFNELVFAVGGYDGFGQLNSVEFYNPKFDQWTTVTPMFERRCNFGIEVLNDRLFVVGGHNGVGAIASTECYDALRNEWYCVQDMVLGRSALKCSVLRGMQNIAEYSVQQDV